MTSTLSLCVCVFFSFCFFSPRHNNLSLAFFSSRRQYSKTSTRISAEVHLKAAINYPFNPTISHSDMLAEAIPSLMPRLNHVKGLVSAGVARRVGLAEGVSRVSEFYVPLASYLFDSLLLSSERPLIVGVSAPQGCGKTTLTVALNEAFTILGNTCVSMSLDDFYLTGAEQDELSLKYSDNTILQSRGNGTSLIMNLFLRTELLYCEQLVLTI
jgi:hypothetical protein